MCCSGCQYFWIGVVTIYLFLSIIFLGNYTNEQYEKELILPTTGKSGAQFTVGYNILMVFMILGCMTYGILDHLSPKFNEIVNIGGVDVVKKVSHFSKKYENIGLILLGAGVDLCLAFLFSSFGLHCHFTNCFEIETPLYILVLIHVGIWAIMITIDVIALVYWGIYLLFFQNCKYRRENIDIEQNQIITFLMVEKIYGEEKVQCDSCKKPFDDSAVSCCLMGHCLHAKCMERSKVNGKIQCEICIKNVI